jgi:PAS domain S-box-containing protein
LLLSRTEEYHSAIEAQLRRSARALLALFGNAVMPKIGARFVGSYSTRPAEHARLRLAAIVESSDDAIISKDLNGVIATWNAGATRIFGYTEAEAVGQSITIIIPPGLHGEETQILRRLRAGEHIEHYETLRVTKEGKKVNVSLTISPMSDSEGRIVGASKIARDITKQKQTEEQLRRLSSQLLSLQDEERRRISRNLHDSTGQNLVALATMLGQVGSSVAPGERKSRALISECLELVDQCIREVRTLSYALYPSELDESDLEDAIRDYVKGFTKRSGIQVELEISQDVGGMERDIELATFRVVQESLTNIQRHSGSHQAKIRIDCDTNLTLEISDLGRGSPDGARERGKAVPFKVGVGILSMQERVKLVGGRLEIDSTSQGTTVRVTVPLGGKEHEKTAHSGG